MTVRLFSSIHSLVNSHLIESKNSGSGQSSRRASVSVPTKPLVRATRTQSVPMEIDTSPPPSPGKPNFPHTMQFFEMSAALIGTLAR